MSTYPIHTVDDKYVEKLSGYKVEYHLPSWTHTQTHTPSPASPFSLLSPSEPILFWVSSVCLENIYFDLFYGSLDALQLWAVMCLIDNERTGKQRERGMERVAENESVSGWAMHLFDNDDPLVQKCVSQSQWRGKAFDTLRTFFGSCLLQLSSCCLWL